MTQPIRHTLSEASVRRSHVMAGSPLLRPVKAKSTFEQTVERLAAAIRLGIVEPGERLPPIRDLAPQLNISRMTLLDALRALALAGYLETRLGRSGGTFVVYDPPLRGRRDLEEVAATLGAAEVLDALAYRSVVEPGAAELAAARALNCEEQARLAEALTAVNASDDGTHRVADCRLHVLIGELSGSPSLAAAVAEVQERLDEVLMAIPIISRSIARSDVQHASFVRAILAGRPGRARQAMAEHVETTAAVVRGVFD